MLVLSRRKGERICIGDGIYVKFISVQGDRALIGIEAPPQVSVDREEVRLKKQQGGADLQPKRAASERNNFAVCPPKAG